MQPKFTFCRSGSKILRIKLEKGGGGGGGRVTGKQDAQVG